MYMYWIQGSVNDLKHDANLMNSQPASQSILFLSSIKWKSNMFGMRDSVLEAKTVQTLTSIQKSVDLTNININIYTVDNQLVCMFVSLWYYSLRPWVGVGEKKRIIFAISSSNMKMIRILNSFAACCPPIFFIRSCISLVWPNSLCCCRREFSFVQLMWNEIVMVAH